MKRTMMATVGGLLTVSGVALAHGGGGGLSHFDRDGNGVVTRDEARAGATERFDKTDVNKDGRITLDEIQASHRLRVAQRLAEKDTNKDGKLSRSEVAKMPDEMFARLDQNKDGSLTADELGKGGEHFARFAERHFQKTDTNKDGAISKDEALAQSDTRFAKVDANKDGVLTQDEMKAHGGKGGHGCGDKPSR